MHTYMYGVPEKIVILSDYIQNVASPLPYSRPPPPLASSDIVRQKMAAACLNLLQSIARRLRLRH